MTMSLLISARICKRLTRILFFRTNIEGTIDEIPVSSLRRSRGSRPCFESSSVRLNSPDITLTDPCLSNTVQRTSLSPIERTGCGARPFCMMRLLTEDVVALLVENGLYNSRNADGCGSATGGQAGRISKRRAKRGEKARFCISRRDTDMLRDVGVGWRRGRGK